MEEPKDVNPLGQIVAVIVCVHTLTHLNKVSSSGAHSVDEYLYAVLWSRRDLQSSVDEKRGRWGHSPSRAADMSFKRSGSSFTQAVRSSTPLESQTISLGQGEMIMVLLLWQYSIGDGGTVWIPS